MSDTIEKISTVARPGMNALLEDVFGLNVRGLRTLKDLFIRPKRVFDSARQIDWANTHTPTIRLTFSLITVYMLLSFFWAAEDGALYQGLYLQLEALSETNPNLPPVDVMIEGWFAGYSVIYPFAYMIMHFLFASFLFVWGKGISWTTRLRMYFGLLSMGMTVALLTTLFLPLITVNELLVFTVGVLGLQFVLYCVTYVRAMAGTFSVGALVWRTPFIALSILIMDFVIGMVTQVISGIWIGASYAASG